MSQLIGIKWNKTASIDWDKRSKATICGILSALKLIRSVLTSDDAGVQYADVENLTDHLLMSMAIRIYIQ